MTGEPCKHKKVVVFLSKIPVWKKKKSAPPHPPKKKNTHKENNSRVFFSIFLCFQQIVLDNQHPCREWPASLGRTCHSSSQGGLSDQFHSQFEGSINKASFHTWERHTSRCAYLQVCFLEWQLCILWAGRLADCHSHPVKTKVPVNISIKSHV